MSAAPDLADLGAGVGVCLRNALRQGDGASRERELGDAGGGLGHATEGTQGDPHDEGRDDAGQDQRGERHQAEDHRQVGRGRVDLRHREPDDQGAVRSVHRLHAESAHPGEGDRLRIVSRLDPQQTLLLDRADRHRGTFGRQVRTSDLVTLRDHHHGAGQPETVFGVLAHARDLAARGGGRSDHAEELRVEPCDEVLSQGEHADQPHDDAHDGEQRDDGDHQTAAQRPLAAGPAAHVAGLIR